MFIKRIIFFVILLIYFIPSFAEKGRTDVGMLIMLGGRYDNLRMCVGSKKGTKGGPIADIMLRISHGFNERMSAGIEIPVMRPVLFGAAFKMLQFEPQFSFNYAIPADKTALLIEPTVGFSFHYGPDYNSDKKNRSESFFASGPILGLRAGMLFKDSNDMYSNGIALRPFYAALFSKDRSTGTVIGGTLEYIRKF